MLHPQMLQELLDRAKKLFEGTELDHGTFRQLRFLALTLIARGLVAGPMTWWE